MRSIKSIQNWNGVYSRDFADNITKIDLKGVNNINDIILPNGIVAICGLNGAGKSTVISAIKDLFGVETSEVDNLRLNGKIIQGEAKINDTIVSCSNQNGERIKDKGIDIERVHYIDFEEIIASQKFNITQTNFDELLDQSEEYEFSEKEVGDLNYIIGKDYTFCGVREFEEIENIGTVPYFRVSVDELEYDSRSMGSGEHLLFYLFWCINKAEKDAIIILEEPETFISIFSQINFANFMGETILRKGIKIILTTHSPYILKNIKNESIKIISRLGNMTSVCEPSDEMTVDTILGIESNNIGTIFVEDRVAFDFIKIVLEHQAPTILKSYTIDIAEGGESAITKRLTFPESEKIKYKFIGVYDGDQKESLDTSVLNWKWCFLPGDQAIESIFRNLIQNKENIIDMCDSLARNCDSVIAILSSIEGRDPHDWFEELSKQISVDRLTLIKFFYHLWDNHNDEIKNFVKEIHACVE